MFILSEWDCDASVKWIPLSSAVLFGSFSLSTKEPYTIMNCPSCVILHHWHQCHRLCIPPPGTGLDIETSYLVYICTYVPIYAHQIFSDSDL